MRRKMTDIKIFLGLLVIALFLGGIGIFFTENHFKKQSEEHFNLVCEKYAQHIDSFFEQCVTTANTISAAVQFRIEKEIDLYKTETRTELVKHTRHILSEYLLHSINKGATSIDGSVMTAYLRFDPRYGTSAAGIFLGVQDGEIKKLPLTDISKYDFDDLEHVGWYFIPANSKKAQWLEPYFNQNISRTMISYVVPIVKGKNVVGVLGLDIDISLIAKKVDEMRILESGFAYLEAKNGEPFLQSRKVNKKYITQTIKLKNEMSLVICVPKEKANPAKYGHFHFAMLFLYLFYTLFALFFGILKIQSYAVHEKKSDSEKWESPLTTVVRAELSAAVIVAFLMLFAQIGFVCFSFYKPQKKHLQSIAPKNTFERTIRVAGIPDFAPYCFLNGDTYSGFFVDLMSEIANRLGYNVEFDFKPKFNALSDTVFGYNDVFMAFEVLSENAYYNNILPTIAAAEDSFIIVGKNQISSILELRDKKIAASTESNNYDLYNLNKTAVIYNNPINQLKSVENGENDYAILRDAVAKMVISNENISGLYKVYDIIESHLGFGVNVKKIELRDEINTAISAMKNDGTLSAFEKKWLEYSIKESSLLDILAKNKEFFLFTGVIFWIAIGVFLLLRLKFKAEYATIAAGRFRLLSETDALTGIRNRGSGEAETKRLLQLKKYGMFCLFDADKFKSINDTFGHETGDQVIKALAVCMQNALREQDILMRLGGDEFAFFAVGIQNEKDAKIVIERLFSCIKHIKIPALGERNISVSLGASFFVDSKNPCDFDELYRRADTELYKCKKNGGASFSFFSE